MMLKWFSQPKELVSWIQDMSCRIYSIDIEFYSPKTVSY